MTAELTKTGLLTAEPDSAGGNRRALGLTPDGEDLVHHCAALLSGRMAAMVEASGVPYDIYTEYTNQLLATLDKPSPGD
jgi:hypothetical protein